MAKAKRSGKSFSSQYAAYKAGNHETNNRLRKLKKLAKQHPNNKQIEAAAKDIHHRRRVPKSPYWSHQKIADAKIFKEFTGKFDKDIYHTDPKLQQAALRARNENKFRDIPKMGKVSMFSLKERAHFKNGTQVWI